MSGGFGYNDCMKEKSQSIPVYDLLHFYFMPPRIASSVVYEVDLGEAIDSSLMAESLKEALSRYPHFRSVPVIENNEIRFKPSQEEPHLHKESHQGFALGTSQTDGFLFVLAYTGQILSLHCHHSLSDGRGFLRFLKDIICSYFIKKGVQLTPEENQDVFSGEAPQGAFAEEHSESKLKPLGQFSLKPEDQIFRRPEVPLKASEVIGFRNEFSLPIAPVLTYAKKAESTPVPLLIALLGQSFMDVYKPESLLLAFSAVDERKPFMTDVGNNGSGSLNIPYYAVLYNKPLAEQASILRSRLDLEIQPRNLANANKKLVQSVDLCKKMPMSPLEAIKIISAQMDANPGRVSYSVSYVGAARFPSNVACRIKRLAVDFVPFILPNYCMGIENNGILDLTLTENVDSPALAEAFYSRLHAVFPDAEYLGREKRIFDTMCLDKIVS